MKTLLTQLATSKKFAALTMGVIASVLAVPLVKYAGLPVEEAKEMATNVAQLVMAYLVAQGVADHGKEAKKTPVQ